MSFPTIYIGGERRISLTAFDALTDEQSTVYAFDLTRTIRTRLSQWQSGETALSVDTVPLPDAEPQFFDYLDAATHEYVQAWRVECRPRTLPN